METTEEIHRTLRELVDDTAELGARAVACGLARLIRSYVPPRLVSQFSMRVAVMLLREVRVEVGGEPNVIFRA